MTAVNPGALIVRTAWVYGPGGAELPGEDHGGGETGVGGGRARRDTRRHPHPAASSQIRSGSPTYTVDLAAGLLDLLAAGGSDCFTSPLLGPALATNGRLRPAPRGYPDPRPDGRGASGFGRLPHQSAASSELGARLLQEPSDSALACRTGGRDWGGSGQRRWRIRNPESPKPARFWLQAQGRHQEALLPRSTPRSESAGCGTCNKYAYRAVFRGGVRDSARIESASSQHGSKLQAR